MTAITPAMRKAAFRIACDARHGTWRHTEKAGIGAYDAGRISAYVTGSATDGSRVYGPSVQALFFRFVIESPLTARDAVAFAQAAAFVHSAVFAAIQ